MKDMSSPFPRLFWVQTCLVANSDRFVRTSGRPQPHPHSCLRRILRNDKSPWLTSRNTASATRQRPFRAWLLRGRFAGLRPAGTCTMSWKTKRSGRNVHWYYKVFVDSCQSSRHSLTQTRTENPLVQVRIPDRKVEKSAKMRDHFRRASTEKRALGLPVRRQHGRARSINAGLVKMVSICYNISVINTENRFSFESRGVLTGFSATGGTNHE